MDGSRLARVSDSKSSDGQRSVRGSPAGQRERQINSKTVLITVKSANPTGYFKVRTSEKQHQVDPVEIRNSWTLEKGWNTVKFSKGRGRQVLHPSSKEQFSLLY